jgi:glycine/D-amino acid oxidase-like deaminating enzyme
MPSSSLWLNTKNQRFPGLQENIKTQAVIVGGGLTGLVTAFYLSRSGMSVVLLEANTIGSGTSGILPPILPPSTN